MKSSYLFFFFLWIVLSISYLRTLCPAQGHQSCFGVIYLTINEVLFMCLFVLGPLLNCLFVWVYFDI